MRLALASIIALGVAMVAQAAWAQAEQGKPQTKEGAHVITLGTRSGPRLTPGRAQTSELLIVNGSFYLIDAGVGVTRRLLRAGVKVTDIGTIFITHGHDDHTGGLAGLTTTEYSYGRTKPINIYGPLGTETIVTGMLAFLKPNADIRRSDGNLTLPVEQVIHGHDVGEGVVYKDANITVTAVENTHFHFPPGSPAYGKYKSFSYRFETPGRTIVFTGDTGPSEAVTKLAKGADLLVTEISLDPDEVKAKRKDVWDSMTPQEQTQYMRHMTEEHLAREEVGKMAAAAGVKTVLLTHLPNTGDPHETYASYRDEVKKYFSGEVVVANDLTEY